jgi:hypothetical protein
MSRGLLKNQKLVDSLYQRQQKEKIYPSWSNSIVEPNILQQIDVLHLPTDRGYKYLLTAIDVSNSMCDAEPMKNMNEETLLNSLNNIYRRKILEKPKILQADNQFKTKLLKTWGRGNDVKMKFTLPYRHRQMHMSKD